MEGVFKEQVWTHGSGARTRTQMQSSAPEPQSTSLAFSGTSGILRKLWGLSLERIKGRIPLLFPQEGD